MQSTLQPTPPSQQYWADRRWIHDHYAQLVADHANQWVAVHRARVLASGRDLATVEDSAKAHTGHFDVVYQFIDDGSLIF